MISCTDFIPAYSELFCYLEETYGRESVDAYWHAMFKPGNGSPLVNFVRKEGIRGCFTYWTGTLNEEAADFSMYLNEKRGFFKLVMHRCPSKGRLVDLREQIGLKPFRDYCLHCDGYRAACEEVGLKYIYDFENMDKAGCAILIYDPKVFDGRVILDEDTQVMHRSASDNPYFHPSFHDSLSRGITYIGNQYGEEAVLAIMARYVQNVIVPLMGDVTLENIERKIRTDYARENCPDAVQLIWEGDTLRMAVDACPAVTYLRENGKTLNGWFRYTTEGVMRALAELANCDFAMDAYEDETGCARYHFTRR